MAGAIALELREKGEENMFAVAYVRCIRISLLIHSFVVDASLGLYSPARCTYLGLLRSIPGCAAAYQGGGYF